MRVSLEAPDPVSLGRALVSGLDIAENPNFQLERWENCIELLEEILQTERDFGESEHEQANALSSLASIWNKLGDTSQAISLARQSLSVCNRLPNSVDRSISHYNLFIYLEKAG